MHDGSSWFARLMTCRFSGSVGGLGWSYVYTVWVAVEYLILIQLCSYISFRPGHLFPSPPTHPHVAQPLPCPHHIQSKRDFSLMCKKNREPFGPAAGTMQSIWDTCLEVVPGRAEWSRKLLSRWTWARLRVRLGEEHPSESSKCRTLIHVCSAAQKVCELLWNGNQYSPGLEVPIYWGVPIPYPSPFQKTGSHLNVESHIAPKSLLTAFWITMHSSKPG